MLFQEGRILREKDFACVHIDHISSNELADLLFKDRRD